MRALGAVEDVRWGAGEDLGGGGGGERVGRRVRDACEPAEGAGAEGVGGEERGDA